MANTGERIEPIPAYIFYVEIDGVLEATFTECSALESEIAIQEYEEGGVNTHVHQLPGRVKYKPLTLKYGTAGSDALWDWYQQICQGQIEKKNISVVLFDYAGEEVRRWDLQAAYPSKWAGPALQTARHAPAIESLTLVHHGITQSK